MSDTLKPGLTATRRVDIDRDKTISFMGDDCRVYSTPNLLYDIEMACRDLLLQHIDAGKDSVGTRVELDHVGATLMGMWVEITVTLTEVNGPAVTSNSRRATRSRKSPAASTAASWSASRKTAQRLQAKRAKAG
jgi:fluoroacetyl-CoA thioesterase